MVTDLNHLQGSILLLLRAGNIDGARSLVASYGANPELRAMFLADSEGRILASTRIETFGQTWKELDESPDQKTIKRIEQTGGFEVNMAQDKENIFGYVNICLPSEAGRLRPSQCGFLYYRKNIGMRKQSALAVIRGQAIQEGAGIGLLAILLWLILRFAITRRMDQLITVARRFSKGDWSARARLTGRDELAKISASLDLMYDAVVKEHDALLYSQAQIKAMFETAADGIISIDACGRIQSINSAAERMFGYSKQQVIGRNISMLMPAPFRAEHDTYLKNYLATGNKKIIGIGREVVGLRSDGKVFPMDLAVSELKHGNERSFTGIIRDISQRKQAENQLRMREEELRLTFDNAPIGIVTCDLDCRFLSANRACTQMVGYTESELLQMKFTDIVHPEDMEECLNFAQQAKLGEVDTNSINQRWVCKDGFNLQGIVHVGLVHGEQDEPKMMVVQMENNTERLNAEYEARQLRDRLAHVGRLSTLGEMAAGIAHEINQPLTAIASYAEACQRLIAAGTTDSKELMHAMKQAATQAHRAGEVIRRLRGFAKKRETQRQNVDVNELIKDVVELAKIDAPNPRSAIQLELAAGLPKINADPVQIQQVILNLIRNGADAVLAVPERNQTLIVRTIRTSGPDPEHIRIEVTDNGTGVSEDVARQIFSPFFSTKPSGMGMGLSICRSIVASHGGKLSFENVPTGGATFYVTLPIAMGG